MDDEELILNYFGKLSSIVVEMRNLGEKITDSQLDSKLLRSVSRMFNAITNAIKQFQELETTALEEIIAKIHEDKLKDRMAKREEKALLARAPRKLEKDSKSSIRLACGRGNGRVHGRRHGKSPSKEAHGEEEGKPKDR